MQNQPLFQRYKQVYKWLKEELRHNLEITKTENELRQHLNHSKTNPDQHIEYLYRQLEGLETQVSYSNIRIVR